MVGLGSGYEFCQPEGGAGAGADCGPGQTVAGDSLRQRTGAIQPARPAQNARVESFHGRLREEYLNVKLVPYSAMRDGKLRRSEKNTTERFRTARWDTKARMSLPCGPRASAEEGQGNELTRRSCAPRSRIPSQTGERPQETCRILM